MNRRDFVAVLVAFCLASMLFLAIPTMSNPTAGEYDPWADIRGPYSDPNIPDGRVDMRDIGYEASLFWAAGDPTKNVTITNWPQPEFAYKTYTWHFSLSADQNFISSNVHCGGYSKLVFYIIARNMTPGSYSFTLQDGNIYWGIDDSFIRGISEPMNITYNVIVTPSHFEWGFCPAQVIDVKGPYMNFIIWGRSASPGAWGEFDIYAYLRNE